MTKTTATTKQPMTQIEITELRSCERRIERGRQWFLEVGLALCTIRDKKLYRLTHVSFEAYCREKWGFVSRYARQLIESSTAARQVHEAAPDAPPVSTERSARELAKAPAEKRAEAWERATATTDRPTAKRVAISVVDVVESESASPELRPNVREALESTATREIMRMVGKCRRLVFELSTTPAGAFLNIVQVDTDLKNAFENLKFAAPAAPCPYCGQDGCDVCKNLGWLPRGDYEQAKRDGIAQ